jgi:hypothetical protein
MNNYTFGKRVIYGLIFGCIATTLYIQNSEKCAHNITFELQKMFKRNFKAHFSGRLETVSLFSLRLTFKNVLVVPLDASEGWHWKAERVDLFALLFSYLFTQKCGLEVYTYNVTIHSDIVDNVPTIKKIIDRFFLISKIIIPIAPEKIRFFNSQVFLHDFKKDITYAFCADFLIEWINEKISGNIICHDGIISCNGKQTVTAIQGTAAYKTEKLHHKYMHPLKGTLSCVFPCLPDDQKLFVFQGDWDGYKGNCFGGNSDQSFVLKKAIIVSHKKTYLIQLEARCKAFLASHFMKYKKDLSGDVDISLIGTPKHITGTMHGKSLGYGPHICDVAEVFFQTDTNDLQGMITFYHKDQICNGHFFIDFLHQTGDCCVKAITPWHIFNEWYLEPYISTFTCALKEKRAFLCEHNLMVKHKKIKMAIPIFGDGQLLSNGHLDFKGAWGTKIYQGKIEIFNKIKPHFFWCKNKKNETLFTLAGHYPNYMNFDARLSYKLVRELMRECFDYDVPGEGNFVCRGELKDDQVSLDINAQDITVSVPETYNFISGIQAEVVCHYNPLAVTVSNLLLSLHKGTIKSDFMNVSWDSDRNLSAMNVPLQFYNCFFNSQKDFFVLFSGDVTLKKEKDINFLLTGAVQLEKGQLKENPLSLQGQKEVTQFIMPSDLFKSIPLDLSLRVSTRQLVYINTPFLTSRAGVDVYLHNTLSSPFLSGTLNLQGGVLYFPYKSLSLLKADITFLPHQPYDPLISIVAQATIKKYTVTLAVSGSVESSHITLNAVPYLTEEQIIALLFTGTVEETLPGMVPVFVVHSLETLLFGSNQRVNNSDSFLKDSLKKIRLVPRFSDQAGRGGVRGAIEIDVSDRLHAMIQKNFSLPEDTRFEVEYIISDDISVKGVKDERGDIGGELEMRFKF